MGAERSPELEHPVVAVQDERGTIIDLVQGESFDAASVISTRAGGVRGNHYHNDTFQVIYLLAGRLRLVTQMPGQSVLTRIVEAGDLIRTPPVERHAVQALEDCTMLVLTRGPRAGRDYESDTLRLVEPLIER